MTTIPESGPPPPTIYTFSISLIKKTGSTGWNLITIPVIHSPMYKASTIGCLPASTINRWNDSRQVYDKVYIVGISPPSADFTLNASISYFVSTPANHTLVVNGTIPTVTQHQSHTVKTIGSSNNIWIGYLGNNTTRKASQIIYDCDYANCSMIVKFVASSQTWKSYMKGLPPSDFAVLPGEGIYSTNKQNFTHTYMP